MAQSLSYTQEELKIFFLDFIVNYRLMIESAENPNDWYNFREPTQIYILWFQPFDQQYMFVTHSKDLPDCVIDIVQIQYDTAIEQLEKWVNEPHWYSIKPYPENIIDDQNLTDPVRTTKEKLNLTLLHQA